MTNYLDMSVIGELLQIIPAQFFNTGGFLSHLHPSFPLSEPDTCLEFEFFEVVSPYTNVNNESAVEAFEKMLRQHAPHILF